VRAAQGRSEEAIRLYRRALELEPGSSRWRRPLADALAARGRLDEAAAVLAEPPADQAPRSAR
jgi:Flp pilus assembly protein TadD